MIKRVLAATAITLGTVAPIVALTGVTPAFADTFSCADNVKMAAYGGGAIWNDDRISHEVYEQATEYNTYKFCHDLTTGDYVFISDLNNKYVAGSPESDYNLYATDVNDDDTAQYSLQCDTGDVGFTLTNEALGGYGWVQDGGNGATVSLVYGGGATFWAENPNGTFACS